MYSGRQGRVQTLGEALGDERFVGDIRDTGRMELKGLADGTFRRHMNSILGGGGGGGGHAVYLEQAG